MLIILFLLLSAFHTYADSDRPILKNWATDLTGTLSFPQLNFLNTDLKTFQDTTSNQLVFLMISSLNDYPLEDYAYEVASQNKIGTKGNDNGILFLVAKGDRKLRFEVGYGLEGALPDALASSIIRNEVVPYFKRDDYFSGITSGLNAVKAAIAGEYKASPESSKEFDDLFESVPILFFIIFFLISLFRRKGRRGGIFFPGGWSSGGFRGGSFGGGFGGGFSGGGGSFGGGGASGSW